MNTRTPARLTLGPLLFHWPAQTRRDFYFRIADEADIDCVYLGEVVCAKREPFFTEHLPEVIARLRAAGKEVVLSTLALITTAREMRTIAEQCDAGFVIEANDVACIEALAGRAFVVGPLINLFNEGTLDFLLRRGAIRVGLPVEVSATSIGRLAAHNRAAETEVQVFGRQILSIAMRCYHARANGLHKDNCQLVCQNDPDGMSVDQLDGRPLLIVNGTETMSHGYLVLLKELPALRQMSVSHYRLSPQTCDMVRVAEIYRAVLAGQRDAEEAEMDLRRVTGGVAFSNGYFHGREGMAWVADPPTA